MYYVLKPMIDFALWNLMLVIRGASAPCSLQYDFWFCPLSLNKICCLKDTSPLSCLIFFSLQITLTIMLTKVPHELRIIISQG